MASAGGMRPLVRTACSERCGKLGFKGNWESSFSRYVSSVAKRRGASRCGISGCSFPGLCSVRRLYGGGSTGRRGAVGTRPSGRSCFRCSCGPAFWRGGVGIFARSECRSRRCRVSGSSLGRSRWLHFSRLSSWCSSTGG